MAKKKTVSRKRPASHRVIFYSVFLIICSAIFYFQLPEESAQEATPVSSLKKDEFNLRWSSNRSAGMEPDAFVKMVKKTMQVKPDARLLNGLINLQYAMRPSVEYGTHEFKQDEKSEDWIITNGKKVLHIPKDFGPKEYYERANEALSELASTFNFKLEKGGATEEINSLKASIDSFQYPLIIKALMRLNELHESTPTDFEIYRLITKGTIILALHTDAYFINDDSLESKALSFFTVLKHFAKEGVEEEEALIAYMLGYPTYILEAISRLPEKGAFAYILPLDIPGFENYIHETKRPLRDVFLYLQALSNREGADSILEREVEKLLSVYGEIIIPAASKMTLKRFTFSLGSSLARYHAEYAVRTMEGHIDWLSEPQLLVDDLKLRYKLSKVNLFSHLFSKAEHLLKLNESKFKGKIFSEEEYKKFYHCILYNLLAKMGDEALKVQANKEQTAKFIKNLGDFSGDYAKLYEKYMIASAEAIFSKPNGYYKLDELVKYRDTAASRLYDLFDLLNQKFGDSNPHLPMAAILMNYKLDDRPSLYRYVSNLQHKLIFNPNNSYHALLRLHRHDPEGQVENGYWLKFMDTGELDIQELLSNEKLNLDRKYYLIKQLMKSNLPLEEWKALVSQKMEENKQDKVALWDYVDALYSEKKFEEARNILLRHAPYFQSANDLSYSSIMARAAYMSLEMSLPEQADLDVDAAYKSYAGFGLRAKANVLQALGKFEEARDVILAYIKRYPQDHSINVELVKYHLLLDEVQKAIDVTVILNQKDYDLRYIGEALVKVESLKENFNFDDYLKPLIKRDEELRFKLSRMALGFIDHDKHDAAIDILKRYAPSSLKYDHNAFSYRYKEDWNRFLIAEKPIRYLVEAYTRFTEANRSEEGMEFVKRIAGDDFVPYLMITGYQILKSPESKLLILQNISDKKDPASQFAALAGAGYFIKHNPQDEIMKKLLVDYFSDAEISSFYYQMGRFLLTGQGHENVKKLAVSESKQIALYYYSGIYYDSINELSRANDWYQAGIFEGTYSYERSWLQKDLQSWRDQSLSLHGILRKRMSSIKNVSN